MLLHFEILTISTVIFPPLIIFHCHIFPFGLSTYNVPCGVSEYHPQLSINCSHVRPVAKVCKSLEHLPVDARPTADLIVLGEMVMTYSSERTPPMNGNAHVGYT